ncbi:hypothetical protein BK133_13985 [Paenibacillus sp. FSL H8-0548]|uniref:hypothetical protein n=1 Tax=Paenibacillus sp. FSL H8-0548 TaxID=1920422 RepID=UPI00096EF4D0|nr:hypothetical protein [Paenibacillus sp. FSL H8-0548]OMF32614.1 hypothetical protein BK133_13985 [Paenibacillus sp. FSL H8-0548]
MKKALTLLIVVMSFLSLGNEGFVHGAKAQIIKDIPLTGIIDIDDRSYSEQYYALQEDGTIWIMTGNEPAVRGPRIEGAVKISGNLVLTANGDVWAWGANPADRPKRIEQLSNIADISVGPANMALNDKGQLYVWGSLCYVSLMRPDFQNNQVHSCSPSEGSRADIDLANLPKFALENVLAIRSSLQSLMVLMNDGKTVQRYGITDFFTDMGMHSMGQI